MDRKPYKTVILSGGVGYNLRALLEAYHFGELGGIELVSVITDKEECPARGIVRAAEKPCAVIERSLFPTGKSFDRAVFEKLDDLDTELVIVADWPYPLPREILKRWEGGVLYPWPTLLPLFGEHGISPVEQQRRILDDGTLPAGVSACLLTAEGDGGKVLAQNPVEILEGDTPEELLRRIWQEGTGIALVRGAAAFCGAEITV